MTDLIGHPPLDAEIEAAFNALPEDSRWRATIGASANFGEISKRRERMAALAMSDEELRYDGKIEFEELSIPGPAGAPELATLVMRPTKFAGPRPCIYFLHGSGMVMPGNRTMMGPEHLHWVGDLGAIVVSVDYRVGPEDQHPAPVEDCYAGLVWASRHAADIGANPDHLILAGTSGGGGLAAATALLNRDRDGVALTHQILICPMLDDREITVSSKFEGVVWDRASNAAGWGALLGDDRGGPNVTMYAAPARATDLSGLPSTYLDTGSSEVFRDEIIDYGARLAMANVPVELHVWSGAMHGSENMVPDALITRAARAARDSFVTRALRSR